MVHIMLMPLSSFLTKLRKCSELQDIFWPYNCSSACTYIDTLAKEESITELDYIGFCL